MTHRGGQDGKMQLIRVKAADGSKLVGKYGHYLILHKALSMVII